MHFEFLVEDASGKIALTALVQKILTEGHTHRITGYKGAGRIPKGLKGKTDVKARILLDRLPRLRAGFGKQFQHMDAAVVVVVDLDDQDCGVFKTQLLKILDLCNPAPVALFRIAIEEMEAWLLGDRAALVKAYPRAKVKILEHYQQDAVCGTWELLGDVVHPGGATSLKREGWPASGRAKCLWAGEISVHMDVDQNLSPSFQVFRDGLRALAAESVA